MEIGAAADSCGPPDRNGFESGVEANSLRSMNVMITKDRAFPPSKGMKSHGHRDGNIDPDHTCLYACCECPSSVAIARKQGAAISIFMIVDQFQGRVEVSNPNHGQHWTENLFAVNPHRRLDVVKQGCPQEESFRVQRRRSPIHYQLCVLADPKVDVGADLPKMLSSNKRSHFCIGMICGPNSKVRNFRFQLLDQCVGKFFS